MQPAKNKIILFYPLLALLLILLQSNKIPAQITILQEKDLSIQDSTGYINISFTRNITTSNLLVLVNDTLGNTIFMETKRNFSGNYRRTINPGIQPAAEFQLNIISDDEKLNKKISLVK
jgi:hypothetical protein